MYPLCLALTRPPMLFGVTQTYFLGNLMSCAVMVFLFKAFWLPAALFAVMHVIGLIGCRYDTHWCELLLARLAFHCPNQHYRGCVSYDPS
jgi:type IV secretory pathway VirB3-like protein